MTLAQFTDDFVRRYTGKSIGFPGDSFKGECLSLTKQFIKEFYKIDPPASGCNGARCYWSVFPHPLGTVLKKVPNTPELIPQKGWIAVWNARTGGGYGHIGTVIDANINTFRSFDQNFGSRNAQIVTHDYKNLYGFLVPLKEEKPPMTELLKYLGVTSEAEARTKLKNHLGEHDGKCDWGNENRGGGHLGSERRKNKTLSNQLATKNEEIIALELEVFNLAGDLEICQSGQSPETPDKPNYLEGTKRNGVKTIQVINGVTVEQNYEVE